MHLNLLSLSFVLADSEELLKVDIEDTDSALSFEAFSAFSVVNPNTHPMVYQNKKYTEI